MSGKALGAIVALGLVWWAAHGSSYSSSSAAAELQESADDSASEDASDSADLSDTDADTTGVKGSETYDEFDTRRDDMDGSAGSYEGYGCTVDCGGHEAGYQWAQDHAVTDASECGGKSWSFEEGCVAYADEQSRQDDDEDDT